MSTWKEQHSCGSASSRVAPASRPSSCGRGSGATACSRRTAPPAATGSTRTTTSSGCDECGSCSRTGLSAAEAARQAVLRATCPAEVAPVAAARCELRRALEQLDDAAAHAAFDRLLADYSTEPCSPASSSRFYASSVRVGSAVRSPSRRSTSPRTCSAVACSALRAAGTAAAGPRAVLACPPGERHDLGLVIFGLALRELGWRITFLGADTPPDTIVETVERLEPEALVLAVTDAARLAGRGRRLVGSAASTRPIWIGGAERGHSRVRSSSTARRSRRRSRSSR